MSNEPLFTTRREFVTGGLTFLSAAATLPLFLGRTATALAGPEPTAKAGKDQRILVVVQLAGGNDGLNTIVPVEMDAYYKARPRIAIPKKDALKLANGVGLHPAATGLKDLFDEGKMAVIQGIGYPNPNRSHFTSMDIWHTADPMQRQQNGWLGRYFDACCKGSDPDPEPIQGIALTQEQPLAMQGDRFMPLAFQNPESLTWRGGRSDKTADALFRKLNGMDGESGADAGPGKNAGANEKTEHFLQRAALKAQIGADEIRAAAGKNLASGIRAGGARRAGGGNQLSQQLQLVARLIAANLPTRIYYVSMGGFDTHTGQDGRHRTLMTQFGEAMREFVDTLEDQKLSDRVLIMSFSEFGRRVQENASGGTDHGEAAPMFLFGSNIKPGVHEKHPSLDNLHRGDLEFGCDFRRVYSDVLANWLSMRPDLVLGRGFEPLRVVRA